METIRLKDLDDKIIQLQKKIEIELSNIRKKIKCCKYLWMILIILLGAIFFSQIKWFQIGDNYVGLVLGFIGIMSTFVVVSNYWQVKEIENNCTNQINQITNQIEADIESFKENLVDEIKVIILDHKIQLHSKALEGLIHYNANNYTASLLSCMVGLYYLIEINELTYYSFGNIILYIRRLMPEKISNQIRVSDSEKNACMNFLKKYNGVDKTELMEFIESLQIKNE